MRAQPALLPRLAARVAELLALGRPALVCFPSHELLERMLPLLPRGLAAERAGMGQAELMAMVDAFRRREAQGLAAVMGGRLAEGLDFPGGELELVVVGLPYPRPSFRLRALVAHLDASCGRGWTCAVEAHALRPRGPGRGAPPARARRPWGRRARPPRPGLLPLLPDLRPSASPTREAARFWAPGPLRIAGESR